MLIFVLEGILPDLRLSPALSGALAPGACSVSLGCLGLELVSLPGVSEIDPFWSPLGSSVSLMSFQFRDSLLVSSVVIADSLLCALSVL